MAKTTKKKAAPKKKPAAKKKAAPKKKPAAKKKAVPEEKIVAPEILQIPANKKEPAKKGFRMNLDDYKEGEKIKTKTEMKDFDLIKKDGGIQAVPKKKG